MTTDLDTIVADFDFLDDWEDRFKYVIDLGRQMPEFPDAARTDTNKVRGCASQVWLLTDEQDDTLTFTGDSDAVIVRGLIAILIAVYSGKTKAQILETDINEIFSTLGLKDHLTQQRSNGFASMVERVRRDAGATNG